jgi:ferredoxin-type protein NapH
MAEVKIRQLPMRQRVRKALLLVSFLLFPITLYYFSPAIALNGAAEGVVNASMIVFASMLVASLVLGRLWCGWACPAGAVQVHRLPALHLRVPDEPGGQPDGAGGGHGAQ